MEVVVGVLTRWTISSAARDTARDNDLPNSFKNLIPETLPSDMWLWHI